MTVEMHYHRVVYIRPFVVGGRSGWVAGGHGQWACMHMGMGICTGMGMGSSLWSRFLTNHEDLVQTTWALGSNSVPDITSQ